MNPTCPLTQSQVLDRYFVEHRAKVIDLAAFLDRVERASPPVASDDHRLIALAQALTCLSDGKGQRARRVLESLSDPTTDPIATATTQSATGAWPGRPETAS